MPGPALTGGEAANVARRIQAKGPVDELSNLNGRLGSMQAANARQRAQTAAQDAQHSAAMAEMRAMQAANKAKPPAASGQRTSSAPPPAPASPVTPGMGMSAGLQAAGGSAAPHSPAAAAPKPQTQPPAVSPGTGATTPPAAGPPAPPAPPLEMTNAMETAMRGPAPPPMPYSIPPPPPMESTFVPGSPLSPMAKAGAEMAKAAALKQAAYEGEDTGPFSSEAAGIVRALDRTLAANRHNYEKHPYQYFLNPAIAGPISNFMAETARRNAAQQGAGAGSLAANMAISGIAGGITSSPAAGSVIAGTAAPAKHLGAARDANAAVNDEHRDAEKMQKAAGPFDAARAAGVVAGDDAIAAATRNREDNPGSYWLNPFVGGPIAEGLARYGRRVNAGMHDSWAGTLSALPTLGIAPAIMGGEDEQQQARDDYRETVLPYEDTDGSPQDMMGRSESRAAERKQQKQQTMEAAGAEIAKAAAVKGKKLKQGTTNTIGNTAKKRQVGPVTRGSKGKYIFHQKTGGGLKDDPAYSKYSRTKAAAEFGRLVASGLWPK